ncbi:MAG: hypothetical protein AAF570_12115, partial [Bacteroidota bacterium]
MVTLRRRFGVLDFVSVDIPFTLRAQICENIASSPRQLQQLVPLIKTFQTGDKIKLTYYRKGKKKTQSLVFKGFPYKQSDRYEIVYSSIKAKKNHLRTIITKPKGKGKFPAVVIIQGVGCINLDHPAVDFYHVLADSLTSKGMVVM